MSKEKAWIYGSVAYAVLIGGGAFTDSRYHYSADEMVGSAIRRSVAFLVVALCVWLVLWVRRLSKAMTDTSKHLKRIADATTGAEPEENGATARGFPISPTPSTPPAPDTVPRKR